MREIFLLSFQRKAKVAVDFKKDEFNSLKVERFSSCSETLSTGVAFIYYLLKTIIYLLWT